MRKARQRSYTNQMKRDVVAAVKSGASHASISRELKIPNQTISKWVQRDKAGTLETTSESETLTAEEAEIVRLKAELAKVTLERDVLAKAVMYFAKLMG